jgi:glutathione S-transferase
MPISQPARAVMWGLAANKNDYEMVMTMPGSRKEGGTGHPDYVTKFPSATVPALDDDGFYLTESNAILAYLGDKFHWPMYPNDPKIRAKIHQYLNWHHRNTREITLGLFAPIMRPDLKISSDQIKFSQKMVNKVMGSFEATLSRHKFVVGDIPTIADLAAYCEIGQCTEEYCGLFDFSNFPNIRRWIADCKNIEGYTESHKMLSKVAPKVKKQAKEFFSKL